MRTHLRALRQAFLTLGCATLLCSCSVVRTPPRELPSVPRRVDPGTSPRVGIDQTPTRSLAQDTLPDEVRALWVVRTTLSHPDSIRVMVERAARAGFNTLLVQVRGRGDAYYQSRWEPRPESVDRHGASFDPLALVIREAHAQGLDVHAWVNAILVGGMGALPTDPTHLIRRRPDLLAVPKALARDLFQMDPFSPRFAEAILEYTRANRDRIEGLYTAPSHPEVKEHLYSIWMDLLESYDLDGLHFDFIRYPNANFDYSRVALERFREWVNPRLSLTRWEELAVAYRRDPLAYVDALPGPWDEFRRNQITDLVERIYYGVKKRDAGMVVSAAVFPDAEDAFRSRFQDWRGWVQAGILDAVAPMAYTPDNDRYVTQLRDAVEAVGADRVWGGVGVYLNSYQGTLDKIRIARELGARGVVLFSYDWAVSEGESDGDLSLLDRVGAEMFRRR
jgi:uncharacterized lipoprotein YddW (UPF0748 family)